MSEQRKHNPGWFKAGFDPRRHHFTPEERSRGFWRAIESIADRYPNAVGAYGRHMVCDFLRRKTQEEGR